MMCKKGCVSHGKAREAFSLTFEKVCQSQKLKVMQSQKGLIPKGYLYQLKINIFTLQVCYSNDSLDTDLCHLALVPTHSAAGGVWMLLRTSNASQAKPTSCSKRTARSTHILDDSVVMHVWIRGSS